MNVGHLSINGIVFLKMWFYILVFAMALLFFSTLSIIFYISISVYFIFYSKVYSNSLYEHQKQIKIVLECVKKAEFNHDVKRSEFHISEIIYLDLIIDTYGV